MNPRATDSAARALTVAVTGVGAIIGQGIVKSLRQLPGPIRIIGIDRSSASPGPHLVDDFVQKPPVAEDGLAYTEFWQRTIAQYGIQLLMPGLEVDMHFFHRHREALQACGATPAVNTPQLIDITADKWRFGKELARIGYPQIPSARPAGWAEAVQALGPPPLLLKPSRGNGSRGIVIIEDEADFLYWTRKSAADWMLQRIVGEPAEEYTVGVFGLGHGAAVEPLIFRRRLSSAGNTQQAEVVREHPVLEVAVQTLVHHFQPVGPTNLQFRVEGDTPYLLEINPRFSSSNSLRTAFGFNEAEMAIDFYHRKRTPRTPHVNEGVAWRYYEDFVVHAGRPV